MIYKLSFIIPALLGFSQGCKSPSNRSTLRNQSYQPASQTEQLSCAGDDVTKNIDNLYRSIDADVSTSARLITRDVPAFVKLYEEAIRQLEDSSSDLQQVLSDLTQARDNFIDSVLDSSELVVGQPVGNETAANGWRQFFSESDRSVFEKNNARDTRKVLNTTKCTIWVGTASIRGEGKFNRMYKDHISLSARVLTRDLPGVIHPYEEYLQGKLSGNQASQIKDLQNTRDEFINNVINDPTTVGGVPLGNPQVASHWQQYFKSEDMSLNAALRDSNGQRASRIVAETYHTLNLIKQNWRSAP